MEQVVVLDKHLYHLPHSISIFATIQIIFDILFSNCWNSFFLSMELRSSDDLKETQCIFKDEFTSAFLTYMKEGIEYFTVSSGIFPVLLEHWQLYYRLYILYSDDICDERKIKNTRWEEKRDLEGGRASNNHNN